MKYFDSYQSALAFLKNAGISGVKPEKTRVWIYPYWEFVWTVK